MLRRLFRRRPPSIPGTELLDTVFDQAVVRLAPGDIEDVYRASLIGGRFGARLMLEVDPRLGALWGRGDISKAAKLVEVWATTVGVHLMQNHPSQEGITEGIAIGMATVAFDSDKDTGLVELNAYQAQRKADDATKAAGQGMGSYQLTVLYLRCFRALGRPVDLAAVPIPIPSIAELVERGLVAPENTVGPEALFAMPQILAKSLQIAKEVFDDLRAQRKG